MTALALHILICGIGFDRISSGMADRVALLGHAVARIAGALRVSRSLQVRPRMRVPLRRPLLLHADVAIAAAGLSGRDREVTEESVGTVGWRVESRPVA